MMALMAVDTGARLDERLTLSRANVDPDNLLVKVGGKGDKERLIPFSLELRKTLYRFLQSHNHQLVFCTRAGGRLSRRNVLRDYKNLCLAAGFKAPRRSLHSLRHTFGTNYIRQGGSVIDLCCRFVVSRARCAARRRTVVCGFYRSFISASSGILITPLI